ncbi:hypothetical protein OIU77_018873 [Salix suchowensis]|uniref:Uncharacterized protein n=1 Tax=Salix suchowensis TaxID=1278906 RepID=A0ABQ9CHU5_9ROSI|nr:hypothetical protein OIU77_018873 [Salix suchowensis]
MLEVGAYEDPVPKKKSTNLSTKNQTKLTNPGLSTKNQTKSIKTGSLSPKNQTKITKSTNSTKATLTTSQSKNQLKQLNSTSQLKKLNSTSQLKKLNPTSKTLNSTKSIAAPTKKTSDLLKLDDEDDLVAEFRDLPSKFHQTLIPDLERISMTSKKYLTKANKDLTKGFKPFVGNKYAPTIASIVSFAFILIPLLLVSLIFNRIKAYFSIQKILIFIQVYLSIYFTILCLSSLVTGLEPLKFFLRHFTVHIRLLDGSSNPWLRSVLAAAVDVSDPGLFHRVWAELKAVRPGSDPGGLRSRAALLRGSVS